MIAIILWAIQIVLILLFSIGYIIYFSKLAKENGEDAVAVSPLIYVPIILLVLLKIGSLFFQNSPVSTLSTSPSVSWFGIFRIIIIAAQFFLVIIIPFFEFIEIVSLSLNQEITGVLSIDQKLRDIYSFTRNIIVVGFSLTVILLILPA
jgi:hypothetical protein